MIFNEFHRVWKTKSSVKYISEMFTKKGGKQLDALYEPHRVVHKAWSSDEKAGKWDPSRQYQYLGESQGGSEAKPAARIVDKASRGKYNIANFLFEYATVKGISEPMIKFTQNYACEEFVAPMNQ